MGNINHKRHIRTLKYYREIVAMKRYGLNDFLDGWDNIMSLFLEGFKGKITEEDDLALASIKDDAAQVYLHCLYFYLYNPDEYDNEYFDSKIFKLIERTYDIVLDYYREHDVFEEKDIENRILDLINASHLSTKRMFSGRISNLKEYISQTLAFFEKKHLYNREQGFSINGKDETSPKNGKQNLGIESENNSEYNDFSYADVAYLMHYKKELLLPADNDIWCHKYGKKITTSPQLYQRFNEANQILNSFKRWDSTERKKAKELLKRLNKIKDKVQPQANKITIQQDIEYLTSTFDN